MGWANGSYLMSAIIRGAMANVPDDGSRRAFYLVAIKAFEMEDCDTLDECRGKDPMYDDALDEASE